MKKVWQIFSHDLKNIRKNWVALVIIGGLVFLPSLYAWLNIYASWDPYSQTDRIPVGIVNEDTGETIRGEDIEVGKELVDTLKDDDSMDWKFLEQDEAMKKLEKGDLFATVLIPEDFSQNLGSVVKAEPEKATVEYYVNEKLNAIAPKITEKGASVIVEDISSNFISTVNGVIFDMFNDIGLELEEDLPDIERFEDYIFEMEERLPEVHETLDNSLNDANEVQEVISDAQEKIPEAKKVLKSGLTTIDDTTAYLNEAEDRLNEMSPKIKKDLKTAKSTADDINSLMEDIESVDVDFEEGKKIKKDINEKVTDSIGRIESVEDQLNGVLKQLKNKQESSNEENTEEDKEDKEDSKEESEQDNKEDGQDKEEVVEQNSVNNDLQIEALKNELDNDKTKEVKQNINEAEIKTINETLEKLENIKAVLVESKENAKEIDTFIDDKKSEVDKIFNNIKDLSTNVSSRLDEFIKEYTESIEPTVLNEVNTAKNTLADGRELLSGVNEKIPEVERLLNQTSGDVDEGEETLEKVLNEYPYVNEKVGELADKLRDVKEEADINEIISLLQNDPDAERGFFSEPVKLDEHSVFPIENYGSGMTPFYTILSLWVGGLLLISLLSTEASLPGDFGSRHVYFGKLLLFAFLGILQTLIVTTGDIFLLGVNMANPIWFVIFGLFCSLIFMTIVYSFVSIFGDVGKSMVIVMLVLQIAGSGGTYPVVLLPKFFQVISPFLPFTYAIDIMREALGGIVWSNVIYDLIILSIFGIIAILFGTLLKKPINKQTNKLMEKSRKSGLFH